MGYYDKFLMHEDKRDKGMNSTTNEKGTDGKKNNSSAYNHDYYMKNKEKWGVKSNFSEYTDDDHDFDEKNYDEKNRLGDTDFYGFQKPDGSWVILEEDMKWTLPAGASREDMIKALEAFSKNVEAKRESGEKFSGDDWQKAATDAINSSIKGNKKTSEKEFDVDAAAMDVIRGKYKNGQERKDALGADYEMVQKRVNELMKQQKSSSSSSKSAEKPKESSGSGSSESSGPTWRGKNKTSSTKSTETKSATKKPTSRKRNVTGSGTGAKRGTKVSGGSVKHSEVYGTMNDWREYQDELFHHGIKGQHWGVRRFQNADGSLKAAGKNRYYGDSDSYTASNGVKVGAPKSGGVAAFRKVQGSRLGGAAINGMAKANTALYGHGKNKAQWKRFEEQTRKENEAVREANRAHKLANASAKQQAKMDKQAAKDQERADYKKNLQEVRDSNSTKEKLLYNDATSRKAAKILTKNKDVTLNEAKQQAHKEAIRNTAIIVGAYGAYKVGQLIVNGSKNDRIASSPSFTPRKPFGTFEMPDLSKLGK